MGRKIREMWKELYNKQRRKPRVRNTTEEGKRENFLNSDACSWGKMIQESSSKIKSKERPLDLNTRHLVQCTETIDLSQPTSCEAALRPGLFQGVYSAAWKQEVLKWCWWTSESPGGPIMLHWDEEKIKGVLCEQMSAFWWQRKKRYRKSIMAKRELKRSVYLHRG